MNQQSLSGAWQIRQVGAAEWLPATVPGGVHTDLMAIGRLVDPFEGDNEQRVMWVADQDWEYRRLFRTDSGLAAAERIFLVCDGLDTLTEVTLNRIPLGRTDNMTRSYRWEVTDLLDSEENELLVTFRSPTRFTAERQAIRPLVTVNDALPGAAYLRKAPCHFGWDWGPKLPAIGIWRGIRLEGGCTARLDDVHVRQHHDNDQVSIEVKAQVERWRDAAVWVTVTVTGPDGTIRTAQAADGVVTLSIENPQLWWPNGLGAQPLYRVNVALHSGSQTAPLDSRTFQAGLRTLELRQQPDRWGRSFTFVVNGVPVFAKGSNWVPADSFPTRVTGERLHSLIAAAAASHQNMLRVWGGGYYEDESFYDLCDRYGILVWQDFMFACSTYPLNDADFVENVRLEVIQNVQRLRHRACLALWCGNNEMETGWVGWGWNRPEMQDLKAADQQFFYGTLPAWVAAADPDHAYWPSSPSSGLPHEVPGSPATGDDHLWSVWHANKPLRFYRQQLPRFVSEFGFQSLPGLRTIAAYAQPAEWNMTSPVMETHQRSANGNGKIIAYLADHYRMPRDFPALVYLTQVLQAEAIQIGVEHWRRQRDRCSGALYWQLNDCWPAASWSSLDCFGRWKALHYAARRFFAPVLLSVEDEGDSAALFITNDTREPWQGEVRWSLEMLDGALLVSARQDVTAAGLVTTPLCRLDCADWLTDDRRNRAVLVAELWQGDMRCALVVAPFVPDKHLRLEDPGLDVRTVAQGDSLALTLQARSLARFVELSLHDADVVFSDNFFDLPAGRPITVACPLPPGWTAAQASNALAVRSLRDSY